MKKKRFLKIGILVTILISGLLCLPKFNNHSTSIIAYNDLVGEKSPQDEVIDLINQYNNNDIIGTLEILGTDYKTVFVQSFDNNYYLRKNLYKKYERGGTPFLDYRVNLDSKKLIIYGHNSKTIDMPFKILQSYDDERFYNNHRFIVINTKEETRKYEIFSVYVETGNWDYMKIKFKNSKSYLKHINLLKERSKYSSDIELSEDDEILILQTCSTNKKYSSYNKKFLLIMSKRVA